MKLALSLFLLAVSATPALAVYPFEPADGFVSVGADIGGRGYGAEISVAGLWERGAIWFGGVAGGLRGHDAANSHGFLGLEAGYLFGGVEAGAAFMDGGPRLRARALLSLGFVSTYVEYLDTGTPSPYSGGVLLKVPVPF